MAEFFLTGEDFTYLSDAVSSWLAYGIGFGAVAWLIGQVVALVWQLVKY